MKRGLLQKFSKYQGVVCDAECFGLGEVNGIANLVNYLDESGKQCKILPERSNMTVWNKGGCIEQ